MNIIIYPSIQSNWIFMEVTGLLSKIKGIISLLAAFDSKIIKKN